MANMQSYLWCMTTVHDIIKQKRQLWKKKQCSVHWNDSYFKMQKNMVTSSAKEM